MEEVDGFSVFKEVSPVWGDWLEGEVVVHVFSGSFEEISEDLGQGKDRGAEVEGESVDFTKVEFAADSFVFFEDFDLVSFGAE